MRYSIVNATIGQVTAHGGRNIKVLHHASIVFAELSDNQAAALKLNGCGVTPVEKVGPSVTAPPLVAPPPTPVLVSDETPRTPGDLAYAAGIDEVRAMLEVPLYGEGYNLAIVGTGIRSTHFLISGRVVYTRNYTTSPDGDGFDHDTGVASIAVAVAPLCGILDIKVIDDNGVGNEEDVTEAIDDLITLHDEQSSFAPHVINLSLGTPDTGNPYSPMRIICRAAISHGILVLASAGNSGPESQSMYSPACEEYVLAVGSLRFEPFRVSDFSSRGPTLEGLVKPDAMFFGENIIMASSEGDTATVIKTGTSFSCPLASGVAILYLNGLGVWEEKGYIPGLGYYPVDTPITIAHIKDVNIPEMCIKPSGVASEKDNSYGYGLLFGPLILEKFAVEPELAVSGLVTAVMAIGMMGIMMKAMK